MSFIKIYEGPIFFGEFEDVFERTKVPFHAEDGFGDDQKSPFLPL